MKKNILSENMSRFGTKNLTESARKKIAFQEALNTIREMGLQEAAIRQLVKEQTDPGKMTPISINKFSISSSKQGKKELDIFLSDSPLVYKGSGDQAEGARKKTPTNAMLRFRPGEGKQGHAQYMVKNAKGTYAVFSIPLDFSTGTGVINGSATLQSGDRNAGAGIYVDNILGWNYTKSGKYEYTPFQRFLEKYLSKGVKADLLTRDLSGIPGFNEWLQS